MKSNVLTCLVVVNVTAARRRVGRFGVGLFALLALAGCGLERIDFDPVVAVDAGRDAGPPTGSLDYDAECRGAVSVCNGLAQAACEARAECSFARACSLRLDFECSDLSASQECLQVPGCLWDPRLAYCSGFPSTDVCERLAPASCAVAAACQALPTPSCVPKRGCAQVPTTECSSVPGCSPSCRPAETLCGGQCADLQTSANHCGSCGVFCAGRCEGGQCFAFAPCTVDAECAGFDDGDACTGTVRCVGGGCQRTPPIRCDDGLDCTEDRCNAVTGACTHGPRDGFCSVTESCDTTSGCVREPACTPGSCPRGEACVDVLGLTFCAPEGETGVGGNCDSTLDCTNGLECTDQGFDDVLGVCGTTCVDDARCGTEICVGGTCSSPCSLLASDTVCGSSLRCQHFTGGVTRCIDNRDALPVGSRCESHAQCSRGSLCIGSTGNAFCRAACEYDGSRACSGGRRCVNLDPPLRVYGREYGACL